MVDDPSVEVLDWSFTSLSNGVYKLDYTLRKAGKYRLVVFVQPNGVGPKL
jgi:hypothetical protein